MCAKQSGPDPFVQKSVLLIFTYVDTIKSAHAQMTSRTKTVGSLGSNSYDGRQRHANNTSAWVSEPTERISVGAYSPTFYLGEHEDEP